MRCRSASPRSTSRASRSWTCWRASPLTRACAPRWPSGSTPRSGPAGNRRSRPAMPLSEAARLYANASNIASLRPVGVACHIGSQISDLAPLKAAFAKMRSLVEQLRGEGLGVERSISAAAGRPLLPPQPDPPHRRLRGGGGGGGARPGRGAGVRARPSDRRQRRGADLSRDPRARARWRASFPGARRGDERPDPSGDVRRLARHPPGRRGPGRSRRTTWSAPVCETGDTFTRERLLPPLAAGDLVAFMTVPAGYGYRHVQRVQQPASGRRGAGQGLRYVIRPRPTYDAMLATERTPEWL